MLGLFNHLIRPLSPRNEATPAEHPTPNSLSGFVQSVTAKIVADIDGLTAVRHAFRVRPVLKGHITSLQGYISVQNSGQELDQKPVLAILDLLETLCQVRNNSIDHKSLHMIRLYVLSEPKKF
jgi:hypothetical protein